MSENPLDPVKVNCRPSEKHMTAARGFQGIPGIETAPGGRLWATWYGGGVTEGPDNFVLLVTSPDNGSTWSEPVAVVDPPGNVRAFDPVLWTDPSGRLWWFWSQSYSSGNFRIHDGRAGVWGVFSENPESPTPSFSDPVRVANGVMMNKPTVLSNGEWALPTAVWECWEVRLDELKDERFSNIVVSSDNGKTFARRGGANIAHRCFDEHMIVELADGRLWMLVRTMYGIGQSFSEDMGATWTPGEDSGLGGPNSRFFIRRLASGRLLLVNHADIPPSEAVAQFVNGATWRRRSHLKAFLSDDDGRSWKGGLSIEDPEGCSYPDGVEGKDGVIRVIYDWERHKDGAIFMASFREEDVLAGRGASTDFKPRSLVNRTGGVRS